MTILFYILIFILGSAIGSFLNVVILRLPEKKSIVKERSHCPKCKKPIKVYDLIPIFSFISLKGKCRHCKKQISWQYPLVELFTGIMFVFLAWNYSLGADILNAFFLRDAIFISALIIIFMTDLRFFLIFDSVTIPMIVFALGINFFLYSHATNWQAVLLNLLMASAIGGGFFLFQYLISQGKWIGAGDIRLGFLMGAMLGWPNVLVALFLAYIFGAVISVFLVAVKKKTRKSEVPFGVFLSFFTMIALIWGNQIMDWYLSFLGF